MTDSEDSLDEERFAAVRFFCEENKKIHYVSTTDIEDFDSNDFSKPKMVKYGVDDNGEKIFEPAQILDAAGEYLYYV